MTPAKEVTLVSRRGTEIAAELLGVKPKISVLAPWMVSAGGIFDRTINYYRQQRSD
ncbi:MAG: hypothetical protein ACLFNP_02995 [Spirochaetaceae bacterium]